MGKKVVKNSRNRSKSKNEEDSITSIVMPAKRGRPPKSSKQVEKGVENSKSSEREKSVLQEIDKIEVIQEISSISTAKRGRPPKSSKQVEKSAENSKVQRVGRPPKSSEREKSIVQENTNDNL